jgi:hypothetical protein
MTSSYNLPVITSIIARDSALLVRWSFDNSSLNETDETILEIHNKFTDEFVQVYIPNLSNLSFRVPNLINNTEYILKITQYLSSGVELASNSLKSTPRSRPSATIEIGTIVVTESPDATFTTIVNYRLYDMLYDDAIIKNVNFKLIDETKNEISTYVVNASSLLTNPSNQNGLVMFKEDQTLIINNLLDGTYLLAATLTNAYGTSVLSEVKTFIVKDMPNNVTDVNVLSGLNNAVQVQFKCFESSMVGFNITKFIVNYCKTSDRSNIMTKDLLNVDAHGVALYAPSATINGNVIIDNLDNGVEYEFSVVAENKRGTSTPSLPVSGWAGLPDQITNVVVNYVTNTTLEASWGFVSNSYRVAKLDYKVIVDNCEIKTGNLDEDDVSLSLTGLNLLDGQMVSLRLIPYFDVAANFKPYTGEITSNGLYSQTYVVESSPKLVFANCDILFATSGVNTKEVQLVAQVHSSGVTAIKFQTKSKDTTVWSDVGTVDTGLVVSGSNFIGTLTLQNVDVDKYNVRAYAVYDNETGPTGGLEGKVTSLDLPKIVSSEVLKLSQTTLELQVSYDSESYPDNVVIELYNNPLRAGIHKLVVLKLAGVGAAVVGNANTRKYTTVLNNISPDTLVYFNVLVKRNVDTSYYVSGDNDAPDAVEGSITYNSFALAHSYYIASQGDVSSLSGADSQIDVVIKFPFDSNKWDRVKDVVLERCSDNNTWVTVDTYGFNAESANYDNGNIVISVLDNNLTNTTLYRYRAFNTPKNTTVVDYPIFNNLKISDAVPFSVQEVNSVTVNSEIDENGIDNILKVDVKWTISNGSYASTYDVLLYSNNTLVAKANEVTNTNYIFNLKTQSVCETLSLNFTDDRSSAEALFGKQFFIEVIPSISIPNENSVYLSKYTKITSRLFYAGMSSLPYTPIVTPNNPSSLTLVSLSSSSATFDIEKPIITDKKPLVKFLLELSLSSSFSSDNKVFEFNLDNNGLTQRVVASELDSNKVYYVRVASVNSLGKSLYLIINSFTTSEEIPGVGAVSVSQNVDDTLPSCHFSFTKITSTTYTVEKYVLTVTCNDGINRPAIELLSDIVLPYNFNGVFGKTYEFGVVAHLRNALNESILSSQSVSQPITLCDKPVFHSVMWTTLVNNNSSVSVVVDPKGAVTVSLLLLALPSDSSYTGNPVFTPSTPPVWNDGLFYYTIDLPYLVHEPPKYIAFVSNLKGSNYTTNGFNGV